ncbi:JAB domain-containing protein [Sphingomonas sp. DG1-23]|uniref:JAB domain-containing protein n=1 Tax=Sphingomonas sp. DG1-23 TaxID=3068316 RepID=UPI00273EC947|nr:JAB domain-containing protein [Sphingomonas sp. DG1-23]MDP5279405.1 JAB domain-containing protein [Sphingomonas sp. DG1-23]
MVGLEALEAPHRLADPAAAGALFACLVDEATEVMAFAYLNGDQRVLGMRHTRSGAVDRLVLPIRDVAADALAFGAAAVVMAHNHPSGDPTPSVADREATRLLARALATLEMRLLDHLIVARDGITSFRRLGLL